MSPNIDALYLQTLQSMESTLHSLSARVEPPRRVQMGNEVAFRYTEKSIHQAIVQKLAKVVSGLHAARLLLSAGFIQEQGALHRMLDEFQEDAVFLCYALINNKVTELHQKYLHAFYMEEFDKPDDPMGSAQKRPMVSRDKIQAYLARIEGVTKDPYKAQKANRVVSKAFSGYVHGASPHIMEMYGGEPPRFHVRGMKGTPLYDDHAFDLWNYFYRGACAFGIAAKAFGHDELFARIRKYTDDFAKASGRDVGACE